MKLRSVASAIVFALLTPAAALAQPSVYACVTAKQIVRFVLSANSCPQRTTPVLLSINASATGAQGPAGPAGPQGPAGPPGPAPVFMPVCQNASSVDQGANNVLFAQANCPRGSLAAGGGFGYASQGNYQAVPIDSSNPIITDGQPTGWEVAIYTDQETGGGPYTLTACVICAGPAQ